MKHIHKSSEKINGETCITFRLKDDKEAYNDLIAYLYPKPQAKHETYVSVVKGLTPVTLCMEIDKAVNKTLLRAIEKFCGVSVSECYDFYGKELDVQTNSCGYKNQLDDYFKRNGI